MKYGIIFWSNSPNSKMIFTLQKRTQDACPYQLVMTNKNRPEPQFLMAEE